MNNQTFKPQLKSNRLTIFLLILSFIWVSIYPTFSSVAYDLYFNYGNVLDSTSPIFADAVLFTISSALISWIGFELITMLYRFLLSFKIYSFVLPVHKLKDEIRSFFIYRNIALGIILNFCFLFPYLYMLFTLFDLIVTMITFICFSMHINKTYSEKIVGHFVFKCFINPVILYEILVVAMNILEVF